MPAPLALLDLKEMTTDPMHVQRPTAEQAITAGGNCVFMLEGDRGSFPAMHGQSATCGNIAVYEDFVESGRGRVGIREACTCRNGLLRETGVCHGREAFGAVRKEQVDASDAVDGRVLP